MKSRKQVSSLINLPLVLDRKRTYILPNRQGLVFILVLLAMLLGSVNYNNNLGFLLTFLLGAMLFISLFYTHRNLTDLHLVTVRVKPVFVGETAVFQLLARTENQVRYAVQFALAGGEEVTHDLYPHKDIWITILTVATKRGLFVPGPLTISTNYPFGLFHCWTKLELNVECLVYPKPLRNPHNFGNDYSASDQGGNNEIPGVDDFKGLKAYQQGDSLQHISWKAYSRGQGLLTKEFVGLVGSSIKVDWFSMLEADIERKLSMLCDLVLRAHRQHVDFSLCLPGRNIGPDSGELHKYQCLKALALFGLKSDQK
ncbi:DUF58 domain-containing protein [candidate division CSSED10-310 bacterium]|uniref:DUF58 domain-containing protein n=1 Tax=candidate division CSSED10-310 bacterium TaxID=2855610 RepID=A0ABV6Z5V2_UNCC1